MVLGRITIQYRYVSALISNVLGLNSLVIGCGNGPNPHYGDIAEQCGQQLQSISSIVTRANNSSEITCFELAEPGLCKVWMKSEKGFRTSMNDPLPCTLQQGTSSEGLPTWEFHYNSALIQSIVGLKSCQMFFQTEMLNDKPFIYITKENCRELSLPSPKP